MHAHNNSFNPLIGQPIFQQEPTPDPINPITQTRHGKVNYFLSHYTEKKRQMSIEFNHSHTEDVSINYFRNIQAHNTNKSNDTLMHVDQQEKYDVWVLHTYSHSHLLVRGNQRQPWRTQSIKLNEKSMESGGDKQEMLHQICRGCFFFHLKTVWKIYSRNLGLRKNNIPTQYFWDTSFLLKCNVIWVIHVCPTFCQTGYLYSQCNLSLILLLPAKCYSTCSSSQQMFKWFTSSVKFWGLKKHQKHVQK